MQKTKRTRFFVVAVLIFSLVTMYADMSVARAATLDSAKDTISDSDLSAVATHVVEFNTGEDVAETETVSLTFNAGFLNIAEANVTCPANTTRGVAGQVVTCTVDAGNSLSSTTAHTITITAVTNPAIAGPYDVSINVNHAVIEDESAEMLVYVVDDVTVTAHVDATLTFGLSSLNSGIDVNGANTTVASTATTIPFGDLEAGTPAIVGQQLSVTTNAAEGFSVTVQQDQDLTSAAGATIDAFVDGTVGAPDVWTSPASTIDVPETYGHMGLTTEDNSLAVGDTFGNNLYAGLNGTNVTQVMYHDGPADGTTDHAGVTQVAYQIEIGDLQEAGDYESTLTYICTPTF